MSWVTAVSDSDLEAMFDNALADFALAHRYEHNAHIRQPIQLALDAMRAEFTERGLPVPYSSPPDSATPEADRAG